MATDRELQEMLRERVAARRAREQALVEELDAVRMDISRYETALSVLTELPTFDVQARASQRNGSTGSGAAPSRERGEVRSGTLRGMTVRDAAAAVLTRAGGGPLRNRQIAELMLEGGYEYDKGINVLRDTVGVILHRAAEDGQLFKKLDKGRYALLNGKATD